LCKNRNSRHKSFPTEAEAKLWLSEISKDPLDISTHARLNYPARLEMSKNNNLAIYYCDCSFEKNIYCGVGVLCNNMSPPYENRYVEDHVRTNHQRGELLGIYYSIMHFLEENCELQKRKFNGLCIFSDSFTSVSLVTDWVPNNFSKQASVVWKNSHGKAVKNQDLLTKIMEFQRTIVALGMKMFVHFIPRDMNFQADRLSRQPQPAPIFQSAE